MGSTPWIGRRFSLCWILGSFLSVCLTLAHGGQSGYGSCSDNCTMRSHLACSVKEGCEQIIPNILSESGEVHDLKGELYYRDRPYLNLTWRVPETGIYAVEGFVIKVTLLGRLTNEYCRHLIFAEEASLRTSDLGKVTFHSGCIELDWGKFYTISVENLPESQSVDGAWPFIQKKTRTKPKHPNNTIVSSSEWTTDIIVTTNDVAAQLTVTFPQAPSEFGITEYEIILTNTDFPTNVTQFIKRPGRLETNKMEYHVFDVCLPGRWNIRLKPNKLQNIQCSDTTICTNAAGVCTKCEMSITSITFNPTKPCGEIGMPPHAHAQIWAIIVGICAACLLTSVFVAIIIYKSNFCFSSPNSGNSRMSQASRFLVETSESEDAGAGGLRIPRKQVLMLYSDDNVLHKTAVKHLAALLRDHSECDVIIDDVNLEQVQKDHLAWLMKYLEVSDKIILVHSEGGFKKFHAKRSGDPYRCLYPRREDLFTPAVEMLIKERSQSGSSFSSSKNTVSVFFPYTPTEYVIREASPTFNYPLMRDMDSLVYHIHNLPRDDANARKMAESVSLANYELLPAGKLLKQAIDDNERFLEANPDWFEKEFSKLSMEGNADSGRGTLQESVRSRMFEEPKLAAHPESCAPTGHIYADIPEPEDINLKDIEPDLDVVTPQSQSEEIPVARQGSIVARLRESFEASADSNLNLARENVRNRYSKNKAFSAARTSPGNSLGAFQEADEMHSKPLHKSQLSSRVTSATSDLGGDEASRPNSQTPSNEPLYREVSDRANNKRNNNARSLKGSIKDYSAYIDDAFGDALYGQSMGEPDL